MRWDMYDLCIRAARESLQDEDRARDVALSVLEDVEQKGLNLSADQFKWRAKWRALDALKRPALPVVSFRHEFDMDDFPGNAATPEEELTAKQLHEQLEQHIGPDALDFLERCSAQGIAAVAADVGSTQEAIRQQLSRARKRAKEIL